jgi:hypothetical protein
MVPLIFYAFILTGATILKETPLFWLNKGGYPIFLREVVLNYYYPSFILYILVSMYIGLRILKSNFTVLRLDPEKRECLSCRVSCSKVQFLSILLIFLLIVLNVGILAANNVANLLNGRPLHTHAQTG